VEKAKSGIRGITQADTGEIAYRAVFLGMPQVVEEFFVIRQFPFVRIDIGLDNDTSTKPPD
jgi:hypothetical protein